MGTNRWLMAGATALTVAALFGGALAAEAAGNQHRGTGGSGQPGQHRPGGPLLNQPGGPHLPGLFRRRLGNLVRNFDRFLGSETRVKDENGMVVTIATVPGKVVSTTGTSVTLDPNDGSGQKTFTLPSDAPDRLKNALKRLQAGDKVVVRTQDGVVKRILKVPAPQQRDGQNRGPGFGPGGPGRGRGGPPGSGRGLRPSQSNSDINQFRDQLRQRIDQRLKGLRENAPTHAPTPPGNTNA